MKDIIKYVQNLYLSDKYIAKNVSLHIEDSFWKVSKIIPLIDEFVDYANKNEIKLLDVGGGAGLILNTISTYMKERHGIKVDKFALDLSPSILEVQKKNNPDLKKALNEDIRKTSLSDKEVDLTLMIDVLEHIPNSIEALKELKRISKFVIFKVPLEDNLIARTANFIRKGKPRRDLIETVGHINVYNLSELSRLIEENTGRILDYYFTNKFHYYLNSEHYRGTMNLKDKLINFVAETLFKISPKICSLIFEDFVVILVECYSLNNRVHNKT